MAKKFKIDITTKAKGKELWQFSNKGFYKFYKYVTDEQIDKFKKKHKNYEILDKTINKVERDGKYYCI